MLSQEAEFILSDLLMKIIQGEHIIELSRKQLSDLWDFNPISLFRSIATTFKSELSAKDLKDFLMQHSLDYSDEDYYRLFRQYASSETGRFSFNDFAHLVLPATKSYFITDYNWKYSSSIEFRIFYEFIFLVKQEFKLQAELEKLKMSLFVETDFSLWKAFEAINTSDSGNITQYEIKEFLKRTSKYITQDDYYALLRRVDLNSDFMISYNEFLDGLIPMSKPKPASLNLKEAKVSINEREELLMGEREQEESKGEEAKIEEINVDDSPRFQDAKEFTLSAEYETPEKTKGKPKVFKGRVNIIDTISGFFASLLNFVRDTEFAKENLVMLEGFSVNQLFSAIDTEKKGEILIYDFEKFSSTLHLQVERDTLFKIFSRHSKSKTFTLSPEDLAEIFSCTDSEYSEILKIQGEGELNDEALEKLTVFLEILLKEEEKMKIFKKDFEKWAEREYSDAFRYLDDDNDEVIGIKDIENTYKKAGLNASGKDCLAVLRRFIVKGEFIRFEQLKNQLDMQSN